MRVLGIDPGTAILGWGIVEQDGRSARALAYGAVRTPAKMATEARLQLLYEGLRQIITQHAPDRAAIEELFFGHNVKTAIQVGQARGVCLLALAQAQVALTELKPSEVKLAVAGHGAADKGQIERMVVRLLRLDQTPKPDDVADALAIALTGYEYWRYQERVSGR
jgi:crossover junction endodeoxyribonuclease RuvC